MLCSVAWLIEPVIDPRQLKSYQCLISLILGHYREYQGSMLDEESDGSDDESDSENDETLDSDKDQSPMVTPKPKRRRLNSSGSFSGLFMDFNHASPGFMKVE